MPMVSLTDGWAHLLRLLLPFDNLPVKHFAIGYNTQSRVIDPRPKGDIVIHQVRTELCLGAEVEYLQLTSSWGLGLVVLVTHTSER